MRLCPSCSSTLGGVRVCPVCGADAGDPAETPAQLLAPPVAQHDTQLRQQAIAAPPMPPPGPGKRALAPIAIGLAVLLVIGGVVAATVILVSRPGSNTNTNTASTEQSGQASSTSSTSGTAQLPTSFTGAPTGQWEVTPSDFLDGPGLFWDARPVGYTELDGAEALYTPSQVVVGVTSDSGDTSSILGLDGATGQLRWRFPYSENDGSPTCFSLPSKHAVACLLDKQLTWVDTRTDEVSKPVPSSADAIVDGPGDSIYAVTTHSAGGDSDSDSPALGSVTVQRGTATDPARDWEQDYPVTDSPDGYDGGVTAAVTDDRLSLGLESVHLLISASDGRQVDQRRTSIDSSKTDPFALTDATTQDVDPSPDEVTAGGARIRLDDDGSDPTTVTASSVADGTTSWSRDLPDPDSEELADDQADGFGRSSIGVSGSSVIFSSQLVLEGWTGFGTGTAADPGGGVQYRTPCGREPHVTAESATGTDGAVHVVLRFVAVCPGGQWVDGKDVVLELRSAAGGVLGQGTYDFSAAPVWLPDPSTGSGHDGVRVPVSLPPGNAFALPSEIQQEVRTIIVPCTHSTGSSGADHAPSSAPAVASTYVPYSAAAAGNHDNADALAALKRIAAADEPDVASELDGRWVPQLSSKQDGTTDAVENHTYDYADILAEHLRLRLQYPNVRLLFSSDWKSYQYGGFWVTVAGTASPGPRPALGFCKSEGFPSSHCYAKHILRDGPYQNASRFPKGAP